jgi:hypothetical protein
VPHCGALCQRHDFDAPDQLRDYCTRALFEGGAELQAEEKIGQEHERTVEQISEVTGARQDANA